jgi:hypothetical protein
VNASGDRVDAPATDSMIDASLVIALREIERDLDLDESRLGR